MTWLRRRLADFFLDPRVALSAPLVVAVLAALQMLLQTRQSPLPGGYGYTHYNNFIIFRQAFVHLVEGRDLYLHFPAEHFDDFLYSPTFAALMAPFAQLPTGVGLVLWDLLCAAILVTGVRSIPGLDARARSLFVWFLLPEFLMWMIAFNHLSESPTFVIAMAGIGLWYFSQPGTPAHRVLLWFAFLFVSVSYSDLVPRDFRERYINPYALKALPVVVIWGVAVAELTLRRGREPTPRSV